jgi:hypothetical protein
LDTYTSALLLSAVSDTDVAGRVVVVRDAVVDLDDGAPVTGADTDGDAFASLTVDDDRSSGTRACQFLWLSCAHDAPGASATQAIAAKRMQVSGHRQTSTVLQQPDVKVADRPSGRHYTAVDRLSQDLRRRGEGRRWECKVCARQ